MVVELKMKEGGIKDFYTGMRKFKVHINNFEQLDGAQIQLLNAYNDNIIGDSYRFFNIYLNPLDMVGNQMIMYLKFSIIKNEPMTFFE